MFTHAAHIQPHCRAGSAGTALGVDILANHPNYLIWQVAAKVSIAGETQPEPLTRLDSMACLVPRTSTSTRHRDM
jgi:hypothetical protein